MYFGIYLMLLPAFFSRLTQFNEGNADSQLVPIQSPGTNCCQRTFAFTAKIESTQCTGVFLFMMLQDDAQTTEERGEGVGWRNRRLAKGEPSGEEASEEESAKESGRETGKESGKESVTLFGLLKSRDEESTGKSIKISVTLPSRGEAPAGLSQEEREERVAVYRQRKRRISSTCRKYGLVEGVPGNTSSEYRQMASTFPWPVHKSLMYQQPWHLLYCWIHKVASTSWSKVFFQLAGKEVPLSRTHEATQRFAPTADQLPTALSTSLVFTVVRHPFERLVSAYRDKFELARKSAYVYSHYSFKISGGRRPSFSQFVDYLLREPVDKYNDHWVPYWLHCHLCQVEYDVVGYMETLQEDMAFIAETTGLASTNISLPWANKRSSGQQDSLRYFRQVDLARTRGLYHIYRLDFEMFGYDVEPYFQLFDTP